MKIGELFVQLGVNADTAKVKDFVKSVGEIPLSVGAAIASLAGIGLTFGELTSNALDMARGLRIFTAETGLNSRELQKWQVVAKQMGISGDVVESSLQGISNALAQLQLGNPAAVKPFSFLGIRSAKDAYDVMSQLRALHGTLPAGVEANLLSQIGVNPQMMALFGLPQGRFDRMSNRGPILSEHALAVLDHFQEQLGAFSIVIEQKFAPVLEQIAPYMGDIAQALGVIAAKALGVTGYAVGESSRLFNEMQKQGGFSNFMENLVNSMMSPEEVRAGNTYGHMAGAVTVNQTINSTADPETVADLAVKEIERARVRASKNFGNGGH